MSHLPKPILLFICLTLLMGVRAAEAQQQAAAPLAADSERLNRPVTLKVTQQPPRALFEALAVVTGLQIRFDPGYDREQATQSASVDIEGDSVNDALVKIGKATNSCWSRIAPAAVVVEVCRSENQPAKAPSPTTPPSVTSMMLVVGAPKVYDDLYLQNQLAMLQGQLAAVHGVDQSTLLSHIGGVQGADLRQTSVGLSGSGPPTLGTSTFTPAAGVPAFGSTGTPTTTTPGTTTTVTSVTPSAPTPAAPTLAPPTVNGSSLATYNESLQLSYEIMNTQLLLGGAVSDHLQTNGKPKTTFTLGFPITITPPSPDDKKLENAVAEIEISVCAESTLESPSVVTLLPQERTYNVASLVDKSFLGSISAVLGGVVNVGGSFLWGHKTYYLVQQQETVAMMRPGRLCQDGSPDVSFAWQIRPVLGNPFLRPGDSTNFVQVSVPGVPNNGSPTQEIGTACVSVHWRLGDKKGNYLGRAVDRQGPVCYPISYYSTSQRTDEVTVTDIGQGNVHVNVTGTFLPGSMVRVGSTLLNPTTITTTHDALTFDVPAKAIIAAEGVYLVGRDNRQQPVVEQRAYQEKQLTINWLDICPYSDTLSKVKIGVSLPKESTPGVVLANASLKRRNGENPWLVLIGDKIFGLSDAPFFAQDDSSITVLAPTDLIRTSNSVEVRRLLWPDTYRDSKPIPSTIFAKTAPIVSKVSVVSSQNGLTLALEGSGLQDLRLEFPKCGGCVIKSSGDTFATVRLAKPDPPAAKSVKKGKRPIPKAPAVPDPTAGLKQILVCRGKPQSQDPQPAHTGQPKNAEPFSDCDEGYPVLPLDVPNLTPPATSVASKSST